jgi:hypothetical protein
LRIVISKWQILSSGKFCWEIYQHFGDESWTPEQKWDDVSSTQLYSSNCGEYDTVPVGQIVWTTKDDGAGKIAKGLVVSCVRDED